MKYPAILVVCNAVCALALLVTLVAVEDLSALGYVGLVSSSLGTVVGAANLWLRYWLGRRK